ncbi:maleylpyruvate isomerase family mycothiol-dependent enzyme [Williamsia herbipolensis]|uniref:Maleylpyruvate isomerase family mycothiol-dependent enzyme n=1 Tax=Williamsia herbipolensis TaxID=1603258 RepID=A0AAU4JX89_9NOCA|nr:maleylpyruvate isomerase family mycothiol-dependent enzyme [Williamsia herbipolensis]
MSVGPTIDEFRSVIDAATHRLSASARSAGLTALVPPCPDWTVADLVAHQGMVHRWAQAQILGVEAPFASESDVHDRVAPTDLTDWFVDGARELLETLTTADPDVEAWVFMETGRTPLEFWTRRQAHETTIHAVDAVAAEHGSVPTAAALDIDPVLAADGLDELLVRFAPRGRSKLYDGEPATIGVETTDTGHAWTLSVSAEALTVTDGAPESATAWWRGTAGALYLGLWNRGDEIEVSGDRTTLERWRARHRVR